MSDAPAFGVRRSEKKPVSHGARARPFFPGFKEILLALSSAVFLILCFPNFDLWFLAWIGLAPLLIALARKPDSRSAFILGWLWGFVFFYGTCYWLTYSLIRYGHIPAWLSYSLLLIPAAIVSIFPAFSCLMLVRLVKRWGTAALLAAPFIWVSIEWARLGVSGQLWNAIGYSQAYVPTLIQPARWGGVYAVGFMVVLSNTALAYFLIERNRRALAISGILLVAVVILAVVPGFNLRLDSSSVSVRKPDLVVVAIQPNVPMEPMRDVALTSSLLQRHQVLSNEAVQTWDRNGRVDNPLGNILHVDVTAAESASARAAIPRLVIWPESPMNFTYGRDAHLRDVLADFARTNHASVLFNSLEDAMPRGDHNSALLVNEEGRLVAQYDKIRLMPFGEYVPLPSWLPGTNAVAPMVGGFTPGTTYPLMPVGQVRAGVFICFESAFPEIARRFTNEGAGVLINVSNDGYLGPTPVMQQHLANAIFRAVENERPVLRVTNTGLTAFISSIGTVKDIGPAFQPAAKIWAVNDEARLTFYTRHGEVFVTFCALVTLIALAVAAWPGRVRRNQSVMAELEQTEIQATKQERSE